MTDTFTAAEKQACIKREVDYRRFVYARRVADGRMKQEEATRQIGLMEAIYSDYEALAAKERLL